MDAKVLVLDIGFQPVTTISWKKAFCLLFQEKIEIIQEYSDLWIHSAKQTFKVPSIVRFIKNTIKNRKKTKFSRDNVYNRDHGKCCFCGLNVERELMTLDHLLPKSRGGKTEFLNVVTCCISCNRKKGDKTPEEANMVLKIKPFVPKTIFQPFCWFKTMPSSWKEFLMSINYWHGEIQND